MTIKIRSRCKKRFKAIFGDISQRVWDIYHACDPDTFQEQMDAFQLWARQTVSGTDLEAIEKLCAKADRFSLVASIWSLCYRPFACQE